MSLKGFGALIAEKAVTELLKISMKSLFKSLVRKSVQGILNKYAFKKLEIDITKDANKKVVFEALLWMDTDGDGKPDFNISDKDIVGLYEQIKGLLKKR